MSKKKSHDQKPHGQRRHHGSEVYLALFLFQQSYQGNHQDLSDVVYSDKIKDDKKWLVLNARDAEGIPILINCLKGSGQKSDEKDHLECIKILVSTGVINLNLKDGYGRTALHWAVMLDKVEICQYLLKQGARLDVYDDAELLSPMHLAIGKSADKFVELICASCSPEMLETADNMGKTPLFHAIVVASTIVFEKLLSAGADPNSATNNGGKHLITHIIENDLDEFLEIILKYAVNLYPNGANKFNVIHMAAKKKDSRSLELISSACSDIDLQSVDHQGRTPLMYAVQYNSDNNVEFLLKSNVDSNLLDNDGKSALHYTSHNPDTCCLDVLLQYNHDLLNKCNNTHRTALHTAIIANNAIVVRKLLEEGADDNMVDNGGHNLIHYTTEYSAVSCLEELINAGLSVNIPDEHNVYPIHYAVRLTSDEDHQTKLDYLKKLIDLSDVQVDVSDNQGLQPIHWAVSMGFVEAVKELLIKDVSANTPTTEEKLTLLHLACHSSQLECLELLLRLPDIRMNQVDINGYTPLMVACSLPDSKFSELLLNAGADPNHVAADGKTPAHIAAGNKTSVDGLWFLSLKGANLDVKGNNGETPLQVACVNPNDASLKFLLTRKCSVNSTQTNGLSALHLAISNKNAVKAQLLLQNYAKCNAILYGEENYTALDIALENGDYKCIKLLQKFGARTSHSILNNAACVIQHTWKRFVKRNTTPDNKSMRNLSQGSRSSAASENNALLECNVAVLQVDSNCHGLQVDTNNFDTKLSLSNDSRSNGISPTGFVMMSKKEFKEKIANGNQEIEKMKELMKKAEQMLVRAKHVNEDADSIINSSGFHMMKKVNRLYIEERYNKRLTNRKTSETSEPKAKEKGWKWSVELVEALLASILEYKQEKVADGEDFSNDLKILAVDIRSKMSVRYPKHFGPERVATEDTTNMTSDELISYKRKVDEQSRRIKIGYVKVREKYKILRKKYNEIVVNSYTDNPDDELRFLLDRWETCELIWGDCISSNCGLGKSLDFENNDGDVGSNNGDKGGNIG